MNVLYVGLLLLGLGECYMDLELLADAAKKSEQKEMAKRNAEPIFIIINDS